MKDRFRKWGGGRQCTDRLKMNQVHKWLLHIFTALSGLKFYCNDVNKYKSVYTGQRRNLTNASVISLPPDPIAMEQK